METDKNIYTHHAKIKRCIESCVTFEQLQSCYKMIANLGKNFSVHKHKKVLVIMKELEKLCLEKKVR